MYFAMCKGKPTTFRLLCPKNQPRTLIPFQPMDFNKLVFQIHWLQIIPLQNSIYIYIHICSGICKSGAWKRGAWNLPIVR